MTKKKLLAAAPGSRQPWRWVEKRKAMVAAAIAGLALASLLASSEIRRAEATADVAAAVAVEAGSVLAAAAAPSPDRVPSDIATRHEREIEAVSGAVAKRYRVARDATRELVGLAYQAGARSGVDPLLIIAVIAVESRFNPIAQSDGGAMGLMQVIPHYHKDKIDSAGSVLDPETNIQLGARVLKEYLRRGGTEVAGLQLYNGSSGDPDNGYAQRVLAEKQRLREALRHERDRNRA